MTTQIKLFVLHAFVAIGLAAVNTSAQTTSGGCVTIECPTNVVAECAGTNGTVVDFNVAARTTCGRIVKVTCTPPSGSAFEPGATPVTCVAIDDFRNTARCEFTVNITDTTPPVITASPQVIVPCTGPIGATVNFDVSARDTCDSQPRLYCVPTSGSVLSIGTTSVICVAVDGMNNQSTATFTVIVTGDCDSDCLAITCPRDPTVAVRVGTSRAVTFSVTATNRCGGFEVPVYCQPPSGSAFPIGTTTVYCLATNSGITKKCSFDVTVKDITPPKLTAPRTLTVPCQGFDSHGQFGATVSYPISATDNTDPSPTITCTPPSGSWLPRGTNSVTCVAADASGNATTNRFQVVVTLGPGCTVSAPVTQLSPDNWGFELGITSWTPTGSAFANQPTGRDSVKVHRIPELKQQMDENIGGGYWQDLTFRVGYKGYYWVGTAENQPFEAGQLFNNYPPADESLTGELLSKPFTVATDYISFLIGGTSDPDNVHVDLLVEADKETPGAIHLDGYYTVEYSTTGHGRELMRRAAWAMDNIFHHVLGKKARIRIVDQSATGHINVDDFQFVNTHPHFQKVKVGGQEYPAVVMFDRYEYDWDSPVWGFADMHTHPMSHLGFAEKVMHGAPDGGANDPTNIALALPDCNCTHGGKDWINNVCGNYLRQAVQMGTDDKGNDPHREGWNSDRIDDKDGREYARFRHWPVFSTKTHQQMWYEWIKRTYDGGLRVMVALCVNNGLLGSASEGEGPKDDLTVGNHQIQALKDFVARHDDFMEIAYDPFQLRDIVRRDKLAIIIGSELDDIGNLCTNQNVHAYPLPGADSVDAYSKQAALNAIDHLYNQGVRYIFPVHLVNNKLGGTPIADVMLNIANRYLNGEALQVELADPSDLIRFSLPTNFDLSAIIQDHKDELIAGAVALPAVLPAILALPDVLGVTPPGSGAAIGAGLLPVALLAGVGLLPQTLQAIPPNVWPINHHYPVYPAPLDGRGHVNQRGLTSLGEFAVREMMKRGMMIDVDHMSQKTLNKVFEMAEANSVGYPLNSGHNSFRALSKEAAENHRTDEQMNHIRELGGLYGVGYENSDVYDLAEAWMTEFNYSTSQVDNDCAGTSKTVSQTYIYGLERMLGNNIALGTDVNGLIPGPGPRFGPNSDFANESRHNSSLRIRDQDNGVLYDQKHGRPIVGPAFIGKGVDPNKVQGFPFPTYKDDNYVTHPGAAYSQEQRDFFMAIRIFYYLKPNVDNGWTQQHVENELQKIHDVISDGYDKDRVRDLALGLLKGVKTWPTGISPAEQLGYYVYREEVLHEIIPQWIKDTVEMPPPILTLANPYERLMSLRGVWYDYHHIFGNNPPLKRCKTGPKDWDINFEGVAHYGMIPDLIQDMVNVGMEVSDLDPLFQSAEGFAQMWTKCLRAADDIVHPYIYARASSAIANGLLNLEWYAEDGDQLEETDDLGRRSAWRLSDVQVQVEKGRAHAVVRLDPGTPKRFFRVRKP